ncbi:MAG: hypothetical protein GF416_08325 [Candidatus Altiarchaeales archaeon]|nr:hypothetical protein [Candidatus Altiarchaeales archaeon]MBD3417121.1 hypothetical protein [Candidatus Altiarchaeales archaeon]
MAKVKASQIQTKHLHDLKVQQDGERLQMDLKAAVPELMETHRGTRLNTDRPGDMLAGRPEMLSHLANIAAGVHTRSRDESERSQYARAFTALNAASSHSASGRTAEAKAVIDQTFSSVSFRIEDRPGVARPKTPSQLAPPPIQRPAARIEGFDQVAADMARYHNLREADIPLGEDAHPLRDDELNLLRAGRVLKFSLERERGAEPQRAFQMAQSTPITADELRQAARIEPGRVKGGYMEEYITQAPNPAAGAQYGISMSSDQPDSIGSYHNRLIALEQGDYQARVSAVMAKPPLPAKGALASLSRARRRMGTDLDPEKDRVLSFDEKLAKVQRKIAGRSARTPTAERDALRTLEYAALREQGQPEMMAANAIIQHGGHTPDTEALKNVVAMPDSQLHDHMIMMSRQRDRLLTVANSQDTMQEIRRIKGYLGIPPRES